MCMVTNMSNVSNVTHNQLLRDWDPPIEGTKLLLNGLEKANISSELTMNES